MWYLILSIPDPCCLSYSYEPRYEISNNVLCATSKASYQPAHKRSLVRALTNIVWSFKANKAATYARLSPRLSKCHIVKITCHSSILLSLEESKLNIVEFGHQRRRPACVSALSDYHFCFSFSRNHKKETCLGPAKCIQATPTSGLACCPF